MASVKFPDKQLTELRAFVSLIKSQPSILYQSELQFFKDYIESIGGVVPAAELPKSCQRDHSHDSKEEEELKSHPQHDEPDIIESDIELDNTGVIDADNDPPQDMGDSYVEFDGIEEKLAEVRQEAADAFARGEYLIAVDFFTKAIKLNPESALMFAKRANCYIHLQKPNACIRDCDRALEINPDSAAARKYRGRANRLLGNWEEAVKDLRLACKIDYDDQVNEWLKEVTPNAKKLEEHRRKYERLREEKLVREKQERIRRAQEEHQKARQQHSERPPAPERGNPFGGMGGMPDIGSLLNDPEVLAAFQDPEVAQAFQDVSTNPANFAKYENNPKIKSVINKMAAKFGGGMGGMSGGFPNFGNPAQDFGAPGSGDDLD